MKKFFLVGCVLAAALFFGGAQTSKAAFTVTLSVAGGAADLTIADGSLLDTDGVVNGSITTTTFIYDGYRVRITSESNSPGGPIPGVGFAGRISETTLATQNVSGNSPLIVTMFSDGFLLGPGPGTLTNSVSGSSLDLNTPVNSSASGIGWVNGGGAGLTTAAATIVGGTPPYNQSAATQAVVPFGSPVSMTGQLTISNLAINGQATVTQTVTLTSVPAPAGLILALAAAPCLGLGAWMRRRKTAAAA